MSNKKTETARLPLLLLSLLAERPMYGYELNQQIKGRSISSWASVGLSSIYQTLEKLVAEGLLSAQQERNPGQGPSHRTIYTLTEAGQARLLQMARIALASNEHQRFDYDVGVGVALTHLPPKEVQQALEWRRKAIYQQLERTSAACQWAEQMLGAWAVLDHQRRALTMEIEWLDGVIERLRREELQDG
jgi:DNA-binding PadR family transcriptional regulator